MLRNSLVKKNKARAKNARPQRESVTHSNYSSYPSKQSDAEKYLTLQAKLEQFTEINLCLRRELSARAKTLENTGFDVQYEKGCKELEELCADMFARNQALKEKLKKMVCDLEREKEKNYNETEHNQTEDNSLYTTALNWRNGDFKTRSSSRGFFSHSESPHDQQLACEDRRPPSFDM